MINAGVGKTSDPKNLPQPFFANSDVGRTRKNGVYELAGDRADYALSSHVAALGLIFSNGSALPEAYGNGAFIGLRGSWNRNVFNGYKVVYVPFENGRPAGKAQAIVTGVTPGAGAAGSGPPSPSMGAGMGAGSERPS